MRALGDVAPTDTWLFCTDADTHVDADWVSRILREATRRAVVGVVGVAPLDDWQGGEEGRAAYDRLLAAKMRVGEGLHQHDHVYGANLAVRADAYLDVGGFSHVTHGEDQALLDELMARGHPVLRTRSISVTTSGRLLGRAPGGLAEHLARLDAAPYLQ
jgi:GT2 family glycosyltransferase